MQELVRISPGGTLDVDEGIGYRDRPGCDFVVWGGSMSDLGAAWN